MFSVSSSPYNSRSRQLWGGDAGSEVYGGWARNIPGADLATATQIRDYYQANPAEYAADAKWAALAARYSNSRADRIAAKAIRDAVKRETVKNWKTNVEGWRQAYLDSRRGMRPKAFRQRLTPTQKANIWRTVGLIPWNTERTSENDRMFLSLAAHAPFSGAPVVPNMPAAALTGLTTGRYVSELPDAISELPANYQAVNFLA